MKKELIIVGSNSPHVKKFAELVSPLFDSLIYIGEEQIDCDFFQEQKLVNFRSKNIFKLYRNYRILKKYIKEQSGGYIHIQQINRLAFFTVIANRSKVINTTAWGSDVLLIPDKNFVFKWMVRKVLKKSKFVTADSEHMINKIHELTPAIQTVKFIFGIDPIAPKEKKDVVYSNRLHNPLYRIDEVIQLFAHFYTNHTNWKLIVAGSGSETEKLKELTKTLGIDHSVEFVGFVDKSTNDEYYATSKIYISIPESDGTAVSLLEAMSAGCIPVVRDLPVAHEWITNGENGVLYKGQKECMDEAISLDSIKVRSINQGLISKSATKKANFEKLKIMYNS